MSDKVTPAVRSRMMGSIRAINTKPERVVRSYLHAVGLRFRLHDRSLPGRPDLVLAGRKVAIFVHGCFWHQHPGCPYATTPTTRPDFWQAKFESNRARDIKVNERLAALDWRVLTIWECEVRDEMLLDALAWALLSTPAMHRNGKLSRKTKKPT
jgi:DNA mismatch endonuclease, patch repair protein